MSGRGQDVARGKSRRPSRGLLRVACLVLAASPAAASPPLGGELAVAPPQLVRQPLELAPGAGVFCRARQLGVDIALRFESAAGVLLAAGDSPLDRRGEELLALPPSAAAPAFVVLEPREKGAPAGQVALRCEELAAADRRLPAFAAASRAAALYYGGKAEERRQAAAEFSAASRLFAELAGAATGEERAAAASASAQALYSRAVLLRLSEDVPAALGEAQASLAAFRALGNGALEAATLNELGLLHWRQGELAAARGQLDAAAGLAAREGDVFTRAAALANLCLLDLVQGAVRQGLACTEAALPAIAAAQAPAIELSAWVNVGRANDVLGEPDRALAAYTRAEQLYTLTGDELGLARTLNNRGVLARQVGLFEQALDLYSRALQLFEKLGERRWRARVLGNLGLLFAELGDAATARQHLEMALAAWRELGDRGGEAVALTQLGRHYGLVGEPARAAEQYRQALALDQKGSGSQGLSLAGLAGALAESGSPGEALPLFEQALELLRADDEVAKKAFILCKQGKAAVAAGALTTAATALAEAARLAHANGLRSDEVCAEKERAELLARQGDLEAALEHSAAALAVADDLRRELVSPDLRASFSRIEHEAYESNVALWMARHRQSPGAAFDARALEMSERARARTFVELLSEARADLGRSKSPEKAARLAAALQRLAAKNERALAAKAEEKARLASEMLDIEREVDRLESEIRLENPRWAELEHPPALSAAAMRGLLDADTVLLVYFLAEPRSFLFRVEPQSIASFELAPRREIEAAARSYYQELASPGRPAAAAGTELARLVLGPLAGRLDGRRLVVVPDGALAYLPFGALPLPGGASGPSGPELLTDGRSVVHLPSIAALALQRSAPPRPAARRPLAIFADPVYDAADPRLEPAGTLPPAAGAPPPWPRLAGSRREAEAIAALAPGALLATDFAARRDQVLGEKLADFKVVHFATHGSIDAARPALSGLVLSRFDPAGQPIEGMLRLEDIYGMRLGADLVVLSGCRTALGEEIRGEGLVGLSRGFFYAGARQVLASLWPVDDFAAAALMQAFYRALAAGEKPEAALQLAQRELRGQRRTRDPRDWAAFVLLGDWR